MSERATQAMEELKKTLTSTPVLALPNYVVFVVETYACDYGIGVVLMQEGHPISYLCKGLSMDIKGCLCMTKSYWL